VDDKTILDRINDLVSEEHELRSNRGALDGDGRRRLDALERQLDQCWDLLRQRRAREEYGEDPNEAHERSIDEVESYLQ
jgi:hypothetical protein